jgi:hypothetical protein
MVADRMPVQPLGSYQCDNTKLPDKILHFKWARGMRPAPNRAVARPHSAKVLTLFYIFALLPAYWVR